MADINKTGRNYAGIIKVLQIISFIFITIMVIVCVVFLKKHNISTRNVDALTMYLTGGTVTVSMILIGFHFIKSFALVISPAILYILSGIVFKNMQTAVTINAIATALTLLLPYFLGRFMGKDLFESLKQKYKAVRTIEEFTDSNSFAIVFLFKAGGFIPTDLSSLIFGSINIPFFKYYIASNLGSLVLNFVWSLVGVKGALSNPLSFLYALPATVLAFIASVILSLYKKKKHSDNKLNVK